jgi:uncharacterized protein (TIGR02453 family)
MFEGFPPDAFAFFRSVRKNNRKEWYLKNKERHDKSVVEPLCELIEALSRDPVFKSLGLRGTRRGSLFRLHRDTRFSSNKEPYKTWGAIMLSRSGDRKDIGNFYLQIEPGNSFIAAGFWQPDTALLNRLRLRMVEDPDSFAGVEKRLRRKGLELSTEDSLKRLPKGFETHKGGALENILKLKSFVVVQDLKDPELCGRDVVRKVREFLKASSPLLEFGWEIVAEWRREGGDAEYQKLRAKR